MEGSKICSSQFHPPNNTSPPQTDKQMGIHIINKYRYKKDIPANTNVFLTLAQRCGLVIFCFNVARTFLERFYILVTIWLSERSENDLLYIKKIPN